MIKPLVAGLLASSLLVTGCAGGPGHTRAAGVLGGTLTGAAIGSRYGGGGALAGGVLGMVAGGMAGEAIAEDQERAMYGPPPPPPPPPQQVIVYEVAPPPPQGVYWVQAPGYSWYWHPAHRRYYYRR